MGILSSFALSWNDVLARTDMVSVAKNLLGEPQISGLLVSVAS